MKLRLRVTHTWWQLFDHFIPWNGGQRCVAAQAARERAQEPVELEPPHDLQQLLLRIFGPNHEGPCEARMGGQRPVPGQEYAHLVQGVLNQTFILRCLAAGGVEPQHAKVSGQFGEMHIEKKTRFAQGILPEALDPADVKRFEHGKKGNTVTFQHGRFKGHWFAVAEHKIDI